MKPFLFASSVLVLAGCLPEKGTLDAYNACFSAKKADGLSETSAKAICAAQEQTDITFDPIDPKSTARIGWFENNSTEPAATAQLSARITNTTADKQTPFVITSITLTVTVGKREFEKRIEGIWIEPTITRDVSTEFTRYDVGEEAVRPKTEEDWSWGITAAQGLRIR